MGAALLAPASAQDSETKAAKKARETAELCGLLTAAADRHGVPHGFFIRLIWKESRFNPNAVSPVGAQGIAQFMPTTARLRGLKNPFDREEALYASASFLSDLEARFGSWALAAAGYNGGPLRVRPFVEGKAGLPYETLDYVYSITGRPAQYWAARARKGPLPRINVPERWHRTGDLAAPAPAPAEVEATLPYPPARRPDTIAAKVDCPKLVAKLGTARTSPRLPGGATSGWTVWGAQVAGHINRSVAMRQYSRLKRRLPRDLVARGPNVVVRRFAARGRRPLHAVQFGAPNRSAAQKLCKRIAKALAPCVVVRNS
ncbi:MAG: lytic transglycosylase domain-containing protein [Pseudomonadota bacterium]